MVTVLVSLLATALVGAAVIAAVGWWWDRAQVSTVDELSFANELRIPPLAEPTVDAQGRKVFDLTARVGETTFKPGTTTPTLGYDGTFGGPTLRADRGDEVVVRVHNHLDEVTTTHWHGRSLPAAADGGPHAPIRPGGTWSPSWTIDQPAATLWYHPHPHRRTEDQVFRGLAGMFIVDDPAADDLALPDDYGVDDLPVIVSDRTFDDDGRFSTDDGSNLAVGGRYGDELLVNGTYDPHQRVTTERVRLRLLNASTARVYRFAFDDGRPLTLIGTDGGLLSRPVSTDGVQLSPGERAEVVVTFAPGDRTVLRSEGVDLDLPGPRHRVEGGDDRFDVLELRADELLVPSPPVPDRLAAPPDVDPSDSVRTRTFELDGTDEINGRSMDMTRVDAVVRAGSVETWDVTAGGNPHSFHVHDVQMQVLSIGGNPPPPALAGWKDTVHLRGTETYRLLIRFSHHADADTPYMFHCHLLRHEDQGMMGQLTVTSDGRGPTRLDAPGDHGADGGR